MTAYLFKVGTIIHDTIPHGTTGLVNANFTKRLYRNGAVSAEVVTVTEIGSSGDYDLSFTPLSNGDYQFEVFETANPSRRWIEYFTVRDDITDSFNNTVIESNGNLTRKAMDSIRLAIMAGIDTIDATDPDDVIITFKDPSGTSNRAVVHVNAARERTSVTLTPSS